MIPIWKEWIDDEVSCEYWLNKYFDQKVLVERKVSFQSYLRRAEKNLDLVKVIYDVGDYFDWIITICYYALYHAILALLSKENVFSKNHSATLCFLIYYHYHKKPVLHKMDINLIASIFDKDEIECIGSIKELREKACYDASNEFSLKLSEGVRLQVIDLIAKIKMTLIY